MKAKRGQVLRGYKSIVRGAIALGMAGCSSSVQLPSLGGPAPDQPQDISCESLSAERARLLAERDDLNDREAIYQRLKGASAHGEAQPQPRS